MEVQPREIPLCQVPGLYGLHVDEVPGDTPTFAFRCKFEDGTRSEPFGLEKAVEIWLQWPVDQGMKPNMWRAIHDCCAKLAQRGWTAMALSVYDRLLARCSSPLYTTTIASEAGFIFSRLERWEEATAFFRRALAAEPTDPEICYRLNNNLGFCLYRLGQYQEAETYLRRALRGEVPDWAARKNLGVVLQAQGRFAEAAGCLVAALDISPMEPTVLRSIVSLLLEHPQVSQEAVVSVDKIRELVNHPLPAAGKPSTVPQPSGGRPT